MCFESYVALDLELDRLLEAGEDVRGLELLNWALEGLPEDRADVLINRAILHCRLDRPAEAFEDVKTLLELEFSGPLHWKVFDSLRSLPGYADVKAANDAFVAEQKAEARMVYRVFRPEGLGDGEACPLAFVLHGDGGLANLEQFPGVWPAEPLTSKGIAVAYVQSSQFLFTNNHGWLPNPEVARGDILEAYHAICEEMAIDSERVLLTGFSGGATTSMSLAFTGALRGRGFIAVSPAPWLPIGVDAKSVARAAKRDLAGVILEGELEVPVEAHETMCEMFRTAALRHRYVINPGIGHSFPVDLGQKLSDAVDFIFET